MTLFNDMLGEGYSLVYVTYIAYTRTVCLFVNILFIFSCMGSQNGR